MIPHQQWLLTLISDHIPSVKFPEVHILDPTDGFNASVIFPHSLCSVPHFDTQDCQSSDRKPEREIQLYTEELYRTLQRHNFRRGGL